jgi:hypothetical protein
VSQELDELVAAGVVERVAADPETARVELEQARLHVESAAEIAERDPVAAFALAYDAIRKALSAHMRDVATGSPSARAITPTPVATRSRQ